MAFGRDASPAQPAQQQGPVEKDITYEARDLTFVDQEEKKTKSDKLFWRLKDEKGWWYTVWEADLLARIYDLAEVNPIVPCVVKVEKVGTSTYYGISGCGPDTEGVAKASNVRQQSSKAPGGRNSEFGKRMHPDDALRVTNLALMERSLHLLSIVIEDRLDGQTRMEFVKANFLGAMQFLGGLCELPKTMTPDAPAPKTEESPATQAYASGTETADMDGDIPF